MDYESIADPPHYYQWLVTIGRPVTSAAATPSAQMVSLNNAPYT